jgi:hypothetical protein
LISSFDTLALSAQSNAITTTFASASAASFASAASAAAFTSAALASATA